MSDMFLLVCTKMDEKGRKKSIFFLFLFTMWKWNFRQRPLNIIIIYLLICYRTFRNRRAEKNVYYYLVLNIIKCLFRIRMSCPFELCTLFPDEDNVLVYVYSVYSTRVYIIYANFQLCPLRNRYQKKKSSMSSRVFTP